MTDRKQNIKSNVSSLTMAHFKSIMKDILDFILLNLQIIGYFLQFVYHKFVPVPEKPVKGEIVLITGTGHGIGRELALQFSSLGAIVVCIDINKHTNDETVKQILDSGNTKAYSFQCDVSDKKAVSELAKEIKVKVGNVSILVNNAGIMPCHSFLDHTEEEIRKLFDINVYSHFWMLQEFLPSMIEKNHGHIVALSSMAGLLGLENIVPYCGSKFAVRGYMEALCEELRSDPRQTDNIYFTTVFPYMVDTGLCKNPKMRFPNLLGFVNPKDVATIIISSVRKNQFEVTIPAFLLYLNSFCRLFPYKISQVIKDFFGSGVESENKVD